MHRRTAVLLSGGMLIKRDPYNGGSSMTVGSKGHRSHPGAHRLRMPWTAAKEVIPTTVLSRRDKAIIEGHQLLEATSTERMAQIDPLDVLKSTVAERKFLTSTGQNVFQLASQAPHDGRGQRLYRPEWMEGTYEKYITLTSITFSRDRASGTAYGYVTFHGETSFSPIVVQNAHVPGWIMDVDPKRAVPLGETVQAPPSIGTDVPVDARVYRLRSYPYYDPPNPKQFVEKLLKDRGVLPDPARDPDAPQPPAEGEELGDGSVAHVV
jgi:hypothetical protein